MRVEQSGVKVGYNYIDWEVGGVQAISCSFDLSNEPSEGLIRHAFASFHFPKQLKEVHGFTSLSWFPLAPRARLYGGR